MLQYNCTKINYSILLQHLFHFIYTRRQHNIRTIKQTLNSALYTAGEQSISG